jgi:hypothetical protein
VAKNTQLGYEADLRKSRDAKSSDQLIKPINLERLKPPFDKSKRG